MRSTGMKRVKKSKKSKISKISKRLQKTKRVSRVKRSKIKKKLLTQCKRKRKKYEEQAKELSTPENKKSEETNCEKFKVL